MHEDRVEEELKMIMNMDTLLPDDKLIALVQNMITSLKAWIAPFKQEKPNARTNKLDITGTWLDKEISQRQASGDKSVGRPQHVDDELYRGRKH